MNSVEVLQKLINITETRRQDVPKLSVMAMAFPYGFGVLCDYSDVLGDYPELLEQRGLIIKSSARGRTFFYSAKLMDFYIDEIHPNLNSEASISAKERINRLIIGCANLGMDSKAIRAIHTRIARKLPSGRLVLTDSGITDLPDPSNEVTELQDLEFIGKSGDAVLIGDSYIHKQQKEYPTLNVKAVIMKAIQVNNAASIPQRKTVAGLIAYIRNFLNRTNPTEIQNTSNSLSASELESIQAVFNAWKQVTGSPATHPDTGQIQKIIAPLKNGYTAAQLQQVIVTASRDAWFSSSERRMTLSFLMATDRLQQLLSTGQEQSTALTVNNNALVDDLEDQIMAVFFAWVEVSESPAIMPDASQHELIAQALKLGYSVDQIRQSFHSAAVNDWHAGTGRYAGQGTKLTLNILLKADILQRNLQDANVFNRSIPQDTATEGLIQVALNFSSH